MSGRKFILYQFPAIFYALLIFAISSIPHLNLPDLHLKFQDKLFHFLEYAIFAALLWRAFSHHSNSWVKRNSFWLTLILGILYAMGDESYQKTVLGRSSEVSDFLADAGWIFVTIMLVKLFRRIKAPKLGK